MVSTTIGAIIFVRIIIVIAGVFICAFIIVIVIRIIIIIIVILIIAVSVSISSSISVSIVLIINVVNIVIIVTYWLTPLLLTLFEAFAADVVDGGIDPRGWRHPTYPVLVT